MKNLNLLIVEGNLQKENNNFTNSGIQTHSESLKESLSYYTKNLNIDVFFSGLVRVAVLISSLAILPDASSS